MTNVCNTQLEWVGNDIFPRLSVVLGYPVLMPYLVLMLFYLANDYLEHAASRTLSRISVTTRYLTILAHFFNSITSQVFCKNTTSFSIKKLQKEANLKCPITVQESSCYVTISDWSLN